MDEQNATETVVHEPVDAAIEEPIETPSESTEAPPQPEGETVVESEVDAPKPNVGEAIKKEVERREAQLKKQYEQEMEAIRQQNAYLEKQAKIYGYNSVEDYMKAVDEHEKQQEIERKAKELGIDPELYAERFAPVFSKVSEMEQKLQTYEQQQQQREQQELNNQKWSELYEAYPHLRETAESWNKGENPEWYNDSMQAYLNKGYEPKDAYELAHKEVLFKQVEQQTLARVTGRDQKQVLPSKDQPNNLQFDPSNMSLEQIEDISRRVRNGERITFT